MYFQQSVETFLRKNGSYRNENGYCVRYFLLFSSGFLQNFFSIQWIINADNPALFILILCE